MSAPSEYVLLIKRQLTKVSTYEKAQSSKRYFPQGINCIGANAADIKQIIKQNMQRSTIRYALEKVDKSSRQKLLPACK
ncbi:MAG: DNA alkylation repair protein [Paraglaciecola sp.]|nr:DNA alkylation repair protein [Paraglaciecola sp.]